MKKSICQSFWVINQRSFGQRRAPLEVLLLGRLQDVGEEARDADEGLPLFLVGFVRKPPEIHLFKEANETMN